MALIVSAASGNFNAGATWVGGIVPGAGDEGRAATGHTITITANATCTEISNDGTGTFVLNSGVTLTANVNSRSIVTLLNFNAASPNSASIVGNITNNNTGGGGAIPCIRNSSSGTLNITGNCSSSTINSTPAVINNSTGIVNITGNVTAGNGPNCLGANNVSTGTLNITGNVTASLVAGANQASTGTLSIIGTVTASQFAAGVTGANVQQVTILSGPFITETTRGVAPVYCAAWRWNSSPSKSTYLEVMTNDLLAKRNLVTADNITGMPAASNVKSGIAYGPSSELTGTFAQTVTPSTADIATAVWGAATRTITGGLVDTLTNAPDVPTESEIATAVWSSSTKEITGGTVTNLTNAPASVTPSDIWSHSTRTLTSASSPTASEIRQEMDSNSTKLSAIKAKTDNLPADPADQSLLEAAIAGVAAPTAGQVASQVRTELSSELAKVAALNTERLANVATTAIVGNLIAQANS